MSVTFAGDIFLLDVRAGELSEEIAEDVMHETFERVFANADANWPVDSGLSDSLLSREHGRINARIFARIRNRAPYTLFIRGGRTWKALVVEPGMAALRTVPAQIGQRLIARLANGH